MKNIQKAIKRVHQIDALSKRTTILSAIHPTYKILIVLLYLIITASYSIHNIYIVVMFLPLLLFSMLGELPHKGAIYSMSSRVQEFTALLPDYNIAGHESILGGMFAGIVGVLVVIGLYMLIHRYHEKHTESH